MTTTVSGSMAIAIDYDDDIGLVGISVGTGPSSFMRSRVSASEFLAAVATECDAIVIPRADLPTFKDWEKELVLAGAVDAESLRRQGLLSFAMAEHLDAHPLVDQAQVDALAALLAGDTIDWPGINDADPYSVARRIIATGRVIVTTEGGPR